MTATDTAAPMQVVELPLDRIHRGQNDREQFDREELEALAESIRVNGLAQPITVRPVEDRFRIVAGERRFRAHEILEWKTIRAIVREDLDDQAEASIMLVENMARVDLNPMEEARAYQARIDQFGESHEEIASRAGVLPSRVKWRLDLLQLCPTLQALTASGELKVGFAWEMRELDEFRQMSLMGAVVRNGLTFKEMTSMRDRLLMDQRQMAMFDPADFELVMEEYVEEARHKAYGPKRLADLLRRTEEVIPAEHKELLAEVRLAVEYVESK